MIKIKEIIQSPLFAKQKKKLLKKQIHDLDKAIKKLMKNQDIGEEKSGDLKGVRVYKFKVDKDQFLLNYECIDQALNLLSLGFHGNFYQKLKKYLKS